MRLEISDPTTCKNSLVILFKRSDFNMVVNLSIAFHALPICMLTSILLDEILQPRYMSSSEACYLKIKTPY